MAKRGGRGQAMEVSLRIDCTPGEARRLLGAPDLLPLCECSALALEDGLVAAVARLDPSARTGAGCQRTRVRAGGG